MKNLLTVLSICLMGLLASTSAYAGGCNIDTSCTGGIGAVCPSVLNPATVGTWYNGNLTFYAPSSITSIDLSALNIPNVGVINLPSPVPVILAEVTAVNNLPDGLSYNCNGLCSINPTVYNWGCIQFYGSPCGETDSVNLAITLQLTVDLSSFTSQVPIPGIPDTFQIPVPQIVVLPLTSNQIPLELTVAEGTNYLCSGGTLALQANPVFDNYAWSTGANSAVDSTITINATGEYFVTVTDGNGCDQQDSVEIVAFGASVATPADICSNQYTRLSASGGDNYTWSPATGLSNANVANPLVYGATATTTYQLIVDNGVCSDTASVTVTVDDALCARSCPSCVAGAIFCNPPAPGATRICPGTVGPVIRNVAYDTTFSFYLMDTVTLQTVIDQLGIGIPLPFAFGVGISEIEIVGVDGLPSGLSWETDQMGGGNIYYPNASPKTVTRQGCITICGTTCADPKQYNPTLQLLVTVDLPAQFGGPQQLPTEIGFDFRLNVAGTLLEITPSGSTDLEVGDSVTLTATAGLSGYAWSNGATTASITVTDPGTYTVSATDGDGCAQTEEVTVSRLVSIAPIDALEASINLFPNPTNGVLDLNFKVKSNQVVTISIMDIQGRTVSTSKYNATVGANTQRIDLAAEATGLYFVKIETSVGTITRKVSLQK